MVSCQPMTSCMAAIPTSLLRSSFWDNISCIKGFCELVQCNFQQFVKVSSMATTILALITDHINFLEQSKQAQAADEVKEVGRSYPDSNLCGQKETGEIYHFKDTAQVRMQLVLVILLFADLDASAQLQQLVGSLLQVIVLL